MAGAHWLLQGDPKIWRVFEFWDSGQAIETWSINRYFHDIEEDDDVALWLSGSSPVVGVYAIGQATNRAFSVDGDADDPLWNDLEQAARVQWRVPIDLFDDFHESPIPKAELVLDSRFERAHIVRMPRGSIFRLTDDEWRAIDDARNQTLTSRKRRNPNWARDELILALDLYMKHRPQILDDTHRDVIELSSVLNALPIHTDRPDKETFRNPNGVHMKLGNFAALDPIYPGAGLMAGGKGDAAVWDRFHDHPNELAAIAIALREVAAAGSAPGAPEEDEDEAEEGKIVFRMHRRYERDRSLREKKKAAALKSEGKLLCEVCDFDFAATYGDVGDGFIEAHHVVPLSEAQQPVKTTLKDLALVCSNCHRMLHRAKPWLRPRELRHRLRRA